MTPDKRPFFAATYIPRESRYGRIGLKYLIPNIERIWKNERQRVDGIIERVIEELSRITDGHADSIGEKGKFYLY